MSRPLDAFWPSHASEPTHDKNYDVASALGIHVLQAYGHIRAFRTRYPQEAPHGVFRGGAAQVERLALWDGAPGQLAAAFEAARVVDRGADGLLRAHDHAEFVGAALGARGDAKEKARIRQAKYRGEKRAQGSDRTWREGEDLSRVTSRVTVTRDALLLTHSLPLDLNSSPEGGGPGEGAAVAPPAETAPDPTPETPVPPHVSAQVDRERANVVADARRTRNAKRAASEAVTSGRPQTPDELLALPHPSGGTIGAQWARRFEAFDGRGGRPTLRECVDVLWSASQARTWGANGGEVLAWFAKRLGEDHGKARITYDRDRPSVASGADPLWTEWRRLKDDPDADVPPFAEWKAKREEMASRVTSRVTVTQPSRVTVTQHTPASAPSDSVTRDTGPEMTDAEGLALLRSAAGVRDRHAFASRAEWAAIEQEIGDLGGAE